MSKEPETYLALVRIEVYDGEVVMQHGRVYAMQGTDPPGKLEDVREGIEWVLLERHLIEGAEVTGVRVMRMGNASSEDLDKIQAMIGLLP